MIHPTHHFARGLLLALPLAFGTALVAAAPQTQEVRNDLQRVEVSGRGTVEQPRHDVRAACPGADRVLQDALAPAVYRLAKTKLVKVQFTLQGDRISEVRSNDWDYRRSIRVAMDRLDCAQHSGKEQVYSFLINFDPSPTESTSYTVALLER